MKAIIREKETDIELKVFFDVNDVSEGACGMLLIQTMASNYLIKIDKSEYLEIVKT